MDCFNSVPERRIMPPSAADLVDDFLHTHTEVNISGERIVDDPAAHPLYELFPSLMLA